MKEGRRHDLGERQDHRCSLAASRRTPHPHGRCRRLSPSQDAADPHLDSHTTPRALKREEFGGVAHREVSRRRFTGCRTRQCGGISGGTGSFRVVHHDRQTHGYDVIAAATTIIIQGSAWPRSRPWSDTDQPPPGQARFVALTGTSCWGGLDPTIRGRRRRWRCSPPPRPPPRHHPRR